MRPSKEPRYAAILDALFRDKYNPGARSVEFARDDIARAARKLGIALPKNLGDVLYSFRYRQALPVSISRTAPKGKAWHIFPAGAAKYRFELRSDAVLAPRGDLEQIKILDATPETIRKHALSDEQALLAIVRYNRLIDIFTGVTAYSLQNHLRTSVKNIGQIEIDELYLGVNRNGSQFVIPVQAKGRGDRHGLIQVWQDFEFCRSHPKFSGLLARPVAVQFMAERVIAMMELVEDRGEIRVREERHYVLVAAEEFPDSDIARLNRTVA